MLRTNIATRPFYNVRMVHAIIALLGIVVIAFTLFNVVQFVRFSARERSIGADAARAESQAASLRGQAARLRAQIDPREVQVVAAAAREANAIIDQRAFSWTDLLAEFERTLPQDVRITAIQPRVERDGRFLVSMTVEGRRVEDIDAFIEALEADGTFRNVLPPETQTDERGLVQAVVDGEYVRGARAAAQPAGGAR